MYPVLKAKGVLPEGITGKTHEEESLPPSAYLAFRWRRKTNDSSNFFSGRLLSHINKSELKSRGYIAKLSVKPQNHTLGRPNVSLERVNFVVLRCPGGSTPCAPIHYEEVSDPRLPHDAAAEFAVGGDGSGGYDVSDVP